MPRYRRAMNTTRPRFARTSGRDARRGAGPSPSAGAERREPSRGRTPRGRRPGPDLGGCRESKARSRRGRRARSGATRVPPTFAYWSPAPPFHGVVPKAKSSGAVVSCLRQEAVVKLTRQPGRECPSAGPLRSASRFGRYTPGMPPSRSLPALGLTPGLPPGSRKETGGHQTICSRDFHHNLLRREQGDFQDPAGRGVAANRER